ncbi:MAG: hypothetical protein ETSY1_33280 [Candidatus Entotheonella factor]|uniref:Uncharacterized protein n=1 Tax=Entotheonella factor TaxID=1429438 RepID=W4LAT5_ENTF1|nr:MAG: hypothetical protein ETSY1_33280 [Candidatus Entotheonella factor]
MKPNQKSRRTWSLKTLIEILPVIIALTALFSYTTIRNVTTVDLVTPLSQVLAHMPVWVAVLMGLIAVSGILGMIWLMYIFCRAPVAPHGGHETNTRSKENPR